MTLVHLWYSEDVDDPDVYDLDLLNFFGKYFKTRLEFNPGYVWKLLFSINWMKVSLSRENVMHKAMPNPSAFDFSL